MSSDSSVTSDSSGNSQEDGSFISSPEAGAMNFQSFEESKENETKWNHEWALQQLPMIIKSDRGNENPDS